MHDSFPASGRSPQLANGGGGHTSPSPAGSSASGANNKKLVKGATVRVTGGRYRGLHGTFGDRVTDADTETVWIGSDIGGAYQEVPVELTHLVVTRSGVRS